MFRNASFNIVSNSMSNIIISNSIIRVSVAKQFPSKWQAAVPWVETVLLALWASNRSTLARVAWLDQRWALATLLIPERPLREALS